ncbi:hypothetical protein ScPMuIL_001554 [Solemya velum]
MMFEMEDRLADNFQNSELEEAMDMSEDFNVNISIEQHHDIQERSLREDLPSILPEERLLEWQGPLFTLESPPVIELSFPSFNTNSAVHVHGKSGKPGAHMMTKSSSVGSIQNNKPELQCVDQDDIVHLTQDVKTFSDGLAKLKIVITESTATGEDARVMSHENLGDVLSILRNILQEYPALQSTDIFSASGNLITNIKNYNYDEEADEITYQALCDAIDQLALAFSSSVSEYLMEDLESIPEKEVKTKSFDNLLSAGKDSEDDMVDYRDGEIQLNSDQIDGILLKLQAGVDLALQRAKAWSKYMKDLASYIERKAQHEIEYAKNLSRLAQTVRPVLTEEGFLPLQSVYCTILAQDIEFASTCLATQTVLETTQFVEPLTARKTEHDKVKRTVKETWMKEVKRMQDALQNLRKAQTLYTRGEKIEEEAMHKAAEAETTYKACVADANSHQQELEKVKAELIAKIREQIFLCDQVIQTVTVDYFHLLHTVSAPIPVQYHALCESSKLYEPGTQFGEFVRRLPVSSIGTVNKEPFSFEQYMQRETQARKPSTQSNGSVNSDHPSRESSPQLSHRKVLFINTFHILSASGSSKSIESSPCNSPPPCTEVSSSVKQLLSPHSTDQLNVSSLLKKQVPPIITMCLKEIERKGILLKGIYRVSGVKSKVEGLCQRFEKNSDAVDLTEEHPNVIANVLKLYLRQLPEPLLTFRLYSSFIQIAKENMLGSLDAAETTERLQKTVAQLPFSNHKTCGLLMYHLQRVVSNCDSNHMNAQNLGIVFGPTLLRPLEGTAYLASLVDTPHQTRAVELLIINSENLFGQPEDNEILPKETPVEKIPGDESEPSHSTKNIQQEPAVVPQVHKSPQLSRPIPSKSLQTQVSHDDKSQAGRTQSHESIKDTRKTDRPISTSSSASDRSVEQFIQSSSPTNTEGKQTKVTGDSFVLPGSTHTDKKDTSSPGGTAVNSPEDHEELSDLDDLHSEDDDLLLPDGSDVLHAQGSPIVSCHKGIRITNMFFHSYHAGICSNSRGSCRRVVYSTKLYVQHLCNGE